MSLKDVCGRGLVLKFGTEASGHGNLSSEVKQPRSGPSRWRKQRQGAWCVANTPYLVLILSPVWRTYLIHGLSLKQDAKQQEKSQGLILIVLGKGWEWLAF